MSNRNPSRPLPVVKNQLRPLSDWIGHINERVICPYDSSHEVRYHRLMGHLAKCEKRAVNDGKVDTVKLVKCTYNSLHRFPVGKEEDHFRECKARAEDFLARLEAGESLATADDRYRYPLCGERGTANEK